MGVSTSGPRRKTGVLLALLCAGALVGGAAILGDGPPGGSGLDDTDLDQPSEPDRDTSDGGDGGGGSGPEVTTYTGGAEYRILLSEPVIPGQQVTATVVKDDQPVEGVAVAFNGDRIGRTDEFGEVTTTVPFVESLNVSAQRASARADAQRRAIVTVLYDRRAQVESDGADASDPAQVTRNESLPTTIDVTPVRDPRPGTSVTLVARIDGAPVSDAPVRLNGSPVGQTDANGRITVDLTWNTSTTVRVTRGSATGTWRPSFAPLQLSVTTGGPLLTAAGLPVRITVTQAGRPVDGATIRFGNDRVGQTSSGGLVEAKLPASNSVTVTATRGQLTTTTRLGWLYLPYLLPLLSLLAVGGGLAAAAFGWSATRQRLSSPLVAARHLASQALPAIVRLARAITASLTRLRDWLSRVVATAGDLGIGAAVQRTVRWFRSGTWLRSLTDGVRQAVAWLVAFVQRVWTALRTAESATDDQDASTATDTTGPEDGAMTIREAFDRVRASIPEQTTTLTPAEIRRRAVAQGLSDTHVETIVDAFRSVTYGQYEPTAVSNAVQTAAERMTDDTGDTADSGSEAP